MYGFSEIYRIEDFDMVPINDELQGKFFGGDSYVIRYTYKNSEGRDAYVVYFWQVNSFPIITIPSIPAEKIDTSY